MTSSHRMRDALRDDMIRQTIEATASGNATLLIEYASDDLRDPWFVYAAQHDCGVVKIGRSKNPDARVRALVCPACSYRGFAKLFERRTMTRIEEQRIHRGLAESLAYPHEWFRPTDRVMDAIVAGLPCEQDRWFYRKPHVSAPIMASTHSEAVARAEAIHPSAVFFVGDDYKLRAA